MAMGEPSELAAALRALLNGRARQTMDTPDPELKQAAVLILVYERDGEYYTVLTQRTARVEHHKGEMALPGGAQDEGEDLVMTALREAREEVGLDPALVEVVGALDDERTITSNYAVRPFVAVALSEPQFRAQAREVAEIVEVPLRVFSEPGVYVRDEPTEFAGRYVAGDYYRYGPYVIFGLTYRILRQFLTLTEPLGLWYGATRKG